MSAQDPSPLHWRIAEALERLATLARAKEQHEAQDAELSPLQARALVVLLRRGSLRVGDVARELLVTDGTISAALSTLEQKGLIAKYRDPAEHRATRLELTRRGRAVAARAAGWTPAVLQPALAALPAAQSGTLLCTLLQLILQLERSGVLAGTRMCVSCRHFVAHGGSGNRPHFCRLLDRAIGTVDLRVECKEHERAGAAQLEAVADSLRV